MKHGKAYFLIPTLLTALFLGLPFLSFLMRGGFWSVRPADMPFFLSAMWVSLRSCLMALAITLLIGTPTAYCMANYHFPGKAFFEELFALPLVLPPAVAGLILLLTFGRNGFLGKALGSLGISFSFSSTAVVITLVFVSLPVYIKGAVEGFRKVEPEVYDAAMSLGCGPIGTFWRVALPVSRGALVSAGVMAWSRALGEFGATMLFAGNIEGVTQTMPLAIYAAMERDMDLAMLLSFILILFSFLVLITVHLLERKGAKR